MKNLIYFILSLAIVSCTSAKKEDSADSKSSSSNTSSSAAETTGNATDVYWGDTHLHTNLSMDAGLFGNRIGLDEAYKFAKGEEVTASIGAVAIQQSNPSVIWVGTGEGNPRNSLNGGYGIYKSLDGVKNWIAWD